MFRFENTYYLYFLLLIPAIWLLRIIYMQWRKKALSRGIDQSLLMQLAPLMSNAKGWIKLTVYTIALACLIFAIANPQFGSKTEEVKRKGVDVMIALDISNSMQAEDLYPTRLDRAKRSIQELLTYLKSDRIGIVVFAGEAFVQLPITTDYSAARLFLESIEPDLITTQGTDIGNAINLCMNSFDFDTPTSKNIILISDGENHEEQAMEAAELAAEKEVMINTIGMGSENGAPIPLFYQGKKVGFRKNKEGNTIVTALDATMLQKIAEKTNGIFVRATNSDSGMRSIFKEMDGLEKVEIGSKVYTDFEDRFQYLLLPALLLFIIELIIPNTKSIWWEKLFDSH
ncbi:MAG: VWA domain-containing protein [Salibacteraceae bacterium]|jgi:Ca-activated chloride channel homolog|nr:VWA domain-containing protein [Salibacteraceae bacterium]MDP4685825.1 VWA domain-containing protein [Salibacteraceae bacterium]MDP4763988.1 VWA domain-containing protein [Salibacteraceae bacterium]MDP4843746.1 VWA domain-containing protein [Salibacteraceae bacterium]MDP4935455.1 VWA domain-containing protein [Salibacteraceae bacterium]